MQGLTDWAALATVMREVARGLAYMHASGRIHRDLKAANILVGPDGKVALAGRSDGPSLPGRLGSGHPTSLSPELRLFEPVSRRRSAGGEGRRTGMMPTWECYG